ETYHRRDPAWLTVQINLWRDRCSGRAPLPPRTLVQQNALINNNVTNVTTVTNVTNVKNITNVSTIPMIAPAATVAAKKEIQLESLDGTTRRQAASQAQRIQRLAVQRASAEIKAGSSPPKAARITSLEVPRVQPVRAGRTTPATSTATPTVSPAPGVTVGAPRRSLDGRPVDKPSTAPANQTPVTYAPAKERGKENRTPPAARPTSTPAPTQPILSAEPSPPSTMGQAKPPPYASVPKAPGSVPKTPGPNPPANRPSAKQPPPKQPLPKQPPSKQPLPKQPLPKQPPPEQSLGRG
ncbi:MAG: hypothetical protein SNJ52_04610, partial [Verrucomicrobiia bacterium]